MHFIPLINEISSVKVLPFSPCNGTLVGSFLYCVLTCGRPAPLTETRVSEAIINHFSVFETLGCRGFRYLSIQYIFSFQNIINTAKREHQKFV